MRRVWIMIIIAIVISAGGFLAIRITSMPNPEAEQMAPGNEGAAVNEPPMQNQTLPEEVQIPEPQEVQQFIGRVLVIPEKSREIGDGGWSGTGIVELRSILGFQGELSLFVVNLPVGVSAEFVEQEVSLSQGSSEDVELQIMIDETAASGSYSLIIEARISETIWGAELELEIVDHLVEMRGSTFVDGNRTIQRGETVVWVNKDVPERFDDLRHDVISADGVFRSPLLGTDELFRYTFDEEGTFVYSCEPHPWMVGRILVR